MIRLELNNFLMNAGILGFIRLLEFLGAQKNQDYTFEENALCISRDYLNRTNLAKGFIACANHLFFNRSVVAQWDKEFSLLHAETKKYLTQSQGAKTEKELLALYQQIVGKESSFKKFKNIEKSYPYLKNTYGLDLKEMIDELIKAKDVESKYERLTQLERVLKHEEVRRHFLIVSVADRVLSRFWIKGFLATSTGAVYVKSGEDMEMQFHKTCVVNLEKYLKEPAAFDSKGKRVCAECGCDHVQSSAPTLSFLNDVMDDVKRKASAFWGFNKGVANLCEVCAFNYLLVPFGFTLMGDKAVFINDNSSLDMLYHVNTVNELKGEGTDHITFKFYNQLVQAYLKKETVQLHNIQLVTRLMDKETQRYQFNILSYNVLHLINRAEKSLEALSKSSTFTLNDRRFNPYEQAIFNLLNHQHQYSLIQYLCRLGLDEQLSLKTAYALRHLWVIQQKTRQLQQELQEGGMTMSIEDYNMYIEQALSDGRKLNAIFFNEAKDKTGLICRLLNAVQSNNRDLFLQTIIRLHGVNKTPLSKGFIESLSNEKLFNDMAHAYLLGFQGVYAKKEMEGEQNNEAI